MELKNLVPPVEMCKHFDDIMLHCEKFDCLAEDGWSCPACEEKEKPKPTVFQQITASPEVLADNLVYYLPEIDKYTSEIIADFYKERAEAIAATVARLKEVADAETR